MNTSEYPRESSACPARCGAHADDSRHFRDTWPVSRGHDAPGAGAARGRYVRASVLRCGAGCYCRAAWASFCVLPVQQRGWMSMIAR
eukprot:scaffold4659_cov125-Isochrysis_galbana.AAC.16